MRKVMVDRTTDTDGNVVSIWKTTNAKGDVSYKVLVNVAGSVDKTAYTLKDARALAGINTAPKTATKAPKETKPKSAYEEQISGFHRGAKVGR